MKKVKCQILNLSLWMSGVPVFISIFVSSNFKLSYYAILCY
nr:MAG TPA: hypothetical protein [Caudoviricetes sp.]